MLVNGTLPQLPAKGLAVAAALAAVLVLLSIPPTAAAQSQESLNGPDVTIIARQDKTILEYRQGGQLRMVKIVPKWGKPYYLVPRDPTTAYGDLERADMLLPSWVIIEF
jgi:negative regulator of replication initiation